MTNEQKLLKLLQIAVDNGYENYYTEPNTDTIIIRNEMVSVKGCEKFSLNDLVTNFEEGEVSFIEALCNADNTIDDWACDNDFYHTYFDLSVNLIRDYISKPTSERLNWLFETFNHLLNH